MGIQTKKMSEWLAANGQAITNASQGTMTEVLKSNLPQMYDGVFIMYHHKNNNIPMAARVRDWPSLQSDGQIAEGVFLVEGGRYLVIAPTEASTVLSWSSKPTPVTSSTGQTVSKGDGVQISGVVTTEDRDTAFADFAGRANTTAIINASSTTNITNTEDYAAGFCNKYSRTNANNKGLTAGKWWLPSVGELAMIWANFDKINYALSKINGATQLQATWYWASTQRSADSAWHLYMSEGIINSHSKFNKGGIRPVSSFLQ